MRYFSKSNLYKNSTGTNCYNPETGQAHSYDWWCYVKVIGGKTVFNDYYYSPTTCKHQSAMRNLLRELGIKIDLVVSCPAGLQSSEAVESVTKYYGNLISDLKSKIANPRSREATNEERRREISHYAEKAVTFKILVEENRLIDIKEAS